MKIGFVLDDSLDKTDGVQQYVLTLGNFMRDQGHDVHYLVGQTKRDDIKTVHSLSKNLNVKFNKNRLSIPLPANKRQIARLLQSEKFDVLHIQMPHSPWLAGRIIKLAPENTAIFGTFHIIPATSLEVRATKALKYAIRSSLRKFDKCYSVSEPARKFAKQTLGIDSSVLPNVIDLANFKTGKKLKRYSDGKLNIVFLGRLVERKGCLELLKAVHAMQPIEQYLRVLICGKGPLADRARQYTQKHGLDKLIEFVGFVSEADKPSYLASADIAVFPSLGGESFGIVLLEAMAAGSNTVLAGNNPGYRSVMIARQQVFDPRNTAEFAKILQKYAGSKQLRSKTLVWQRQYVRQYDVKSVGQRLLDSYAEVLKSKSVTG